MAYLGYVGVQVVHEHVHDCSGMATSCRVLPERVGLHGQGWPEAIHVDVTILAQLLGKLWSQSGVQSAGKVTQGISKTKLKASTIIIYLENETVETK